MRHLRLPGDRMSDGEVVPTAHTERTYLWLGETDEGIQVGPVDMDIKVGDTLLIYARKFSEQWVAQVDEISAQQMAKVTRL